MSSHGLQFYEASHRYKLDGEWVSGVTTTLSAAIPKPGLPRWAAGSVAQYVAQNKALIEELYKSDSVAMIGELREQPWTERDAAGKRGTEVHNAAQLIVQGETVDVPIEIAGHVEACARFLDDWLIEPVLVEAFVGSREHKYAGRLDLIADHKRGPRAIFDYKTSKSGIHFETAYQLAGYGFAEFHGDNGDESPMADLDIACSYGVHIRADGYTVYPLKYGRAVYHEWLHLLQGARIITKARGNYKVPGSGYVGIGIPEGEVA